ncbi:hypothetical protein Tco_0688039 [Tanacetum coccineum]
MEEEIAVNERQKLEISTRSPLPEEYMVDFSLLMIALRVPAALYQHSAFISAASTIQVVNADSNVNLLLLSYTTYFFLLLMIQAMFLKYILHSFVAMAMLSVRINRFEKKVVVKIQVYIQRWLPGYGDDVVIPAVDAADGVSTDGIFATGVFVAAGNGSDGVSVAAGVGADGVSVILSKFGLGYGDTFGSDEVFDLSAPSIFDSCLKDAKEKPLYDWFVKPVGMHAVPPSINRAFHGLFQTSLTLMSTRFTIPAYVPTSSRNRPTSVPAGRPFPAGWHNPAARPMTRPKKANIFQQFIKGGGTVTFGVCGVEMVKSLEKGTIRTSNFNFENVYYVEELQNFNLLSWVPRRHNLYCFNLTDIIPEREIKWVLVTSDHLGKFEGKADEGFLVGYSAYSKAYRVYNLSNKKIEETLNLRLYGKINLRFRVTQDTNTHAGTHDDSDSECDEQVIVVPSFPSNHFSGPKVHTASAIVESTSDYAEELARLQGQAYESQILQQRILGKNS